MTTPAEQGKKQQKTNKKPLLKIYICNIYI
jgi:hypothetical protein